MNFPSSFATSVVAIRQIIHAMDAKVSHFAILDTQALLTGSDSQKMGNNMDYKEIIIWLKEMQDLKVKYKGCGEPEKSAIEAINELLSGIKAAEARAEKAEKERDAAVFDLLRAEEAAEETNMILDDEVHPSCDYYLYLSIHDSVSEIVNWEKDDVWRKQMRNEYV